MYNDDTRNGMPKFSLFYNNVRSLKRNFESEETHLLNELEYHFSVMESSSSSESIERSRDYQ